MPRRISAFDDIDGTWTYISATPFLTTISCVLKHTLIQYAGMTQDALRTKWKFVVEYQYEDEETKEISGTIGQADTREECEGLLEFDMQYHDSHGRIVLNAEAAEVCAKCEGEGKIAAVHGGWTFAMPVMDALARSQI